MKTKEEVKQAIEAALDHVHTDEAVLLKQCTSEHAILNMGQTVEDFATYVYGDPARFFEACFSSFYQQSESDEMAEGLEDERRSFTKYVKADIKAVKKAKLPLTVRNCRDAYEKKGPFAAKK